jgi:hypothetical protein
MDAKLRLDIYHTVSYARGTALLSSVLFDLSETRISPEIQELINNVHAAAVESVHFAWLALRLEFDSRFCASTTRAMQDGALMTLRLILNRALDTDPAIVATVEKAYQDVSGINEILATLTHANIFNPPSEDELRAMYQASASVYPALFPALDTSA